MTFHMEIKSFEQIRQNMRTQARRTVAVASAAEESRSRDLRFIGILCRIGFDFASGCDKISDGFPRGQSEEDSI